MEGIKVEFVFTPEQLAALEQRIIEAVGKALIQNMAAIRSEQTNLTRKEAAERLKISVRNLDRYIADGSIRVNRLKRAILIPESEIENFLKQSA
jgi:excisionase family DNA binding protein